MHRTLLATPQAPISSYTLRDIVVRNLRSIGEESTVEEAIGFLRSNLISGTIVHDRREEVVGVVSMTDLTGRAGHASVRTVMTPLVFSIGVHVPVPVAARLMADSRLHRLFVEEDGRIVGIVTLTDIVRLVGDVGLGTGTPDEQRDVPLAEVIQVDRPRDAFLASLGRCGEELPDVFYELFMASSPLVRARFSGTDMEAQKRKIAAALRLAADAIVGEPAALAELTLQARRHGRDRLDVAPELYERWLEALITAVSRCDPLYGPAVEHVWRVMMGYIVRRMIHFY